MREAKFVARGSQQQLCDLIAGFEISRWCHRHGTFTSTR
ncbi:hypothetical protein TIFTF001_005826 [Ficus carica]|uniref:Uncharacterized protein n=1 Tax=Ficus carica TaxID=3494 RepID=A0AA87ZPR6_FICCA|nr:hypothetical protein TIFTF001_005826 [Ficus carica]